jgi:hypothetical protein
MVIHERLGRWLSPRSLQLVFGVCALVAGVLISLRQDAPHPLFQKCGQRRPSQTAVAASLVCA